MTGQVPPQFPFEDARAIFARMGDNAVLLMPIDTAHRIMAVNLNASKSMETDVTVDLRLTDVRKNSKNQPETYTLQVRKGVLEVDPPATGSGRLVITTASLTWKKLVLGKLDPETAVSGASVVISGGTPAEFYSFMALFR